jgi:hypothetical protein
VVGIAFNHDAIDAQLPATGDPEAASQLDDIVEQIMQGLGLDGAGPPDERGILGRPRRIDAAELAQDQAVVEPMLRLFVTEALEALHQQHPQNHLN